MFSGRTHRWPSEILTITLLVILGFILTDVLVDKLKVEALTRLILRIAIQGEFIAILYLFFQVKESSRRLKGIEKKIAVRRLQRTRKGRPLRMHTIH